MSILLNNQGYDNNTWYQALSDLFPETKVYVFNQVLTIENIADEIEYAVIWNHPEGDLQRYPNLKGILLLGAGTEHIDQDSNIPDVPIVRLIDPEVLNDMALYTLYWVMNLHRHYDTYRQQQQEKTWLRHSICMPADYNVTVLGLGAVGKTVASRLQSSGFSVNGWDAYPQTLDNIDCFNGKDALPRALGHTDVLVNCLPLNPSTRHFINRDLLTLLPQGAALINISRGDIIADVDLLAVLDSEHLSAAILDAFSIEPLPEDSPYWHHPKITVTPHMSGATYARSAAKLIAENILRIEKGETPFPLHQHPSQQ